MTQLSAAARAPVSSLHRVSIGRMLLAQPLAALAAVVILAMAILALLAPAIAHWLDAPADAVDLLGRFSPPSPEHPLGTDELGRDLLVRLAYGGRISLALGIVAALAATVLGIAIGLPAGYYGGRFDALLMRLTDGVIALPLLPLLIVLAAIDLGKLGLPPDWAYSPVASFWRVAIIVALVGWTTVARLVRGATLSIREHDYVRAARSIGARPARIMLVHILPNLATPLLVALTLAVGNVILFESVLSFLGLGIQPPWPSWGNMLTNAQELIWSAPMLAIWPGLCIFVTVIAFNLLGDGLDALLDPRGRRD
jgi:peptide/nickel transport system permease protein